MRHVVLAAAIGLSVLRSPDATAGETVSDVLARAAASEANGEPGDALTLYRGVVTERGDDRLARRAQARIEWLEQRQEGAFEPLADLMRERARQSRAPDAASLADFAARIPGYPTGRVRRESWQLVADTWLERLDRPAEALAAYEAWSREPSLDRAEFELAAAGAALARARLGDAAEALAQLDRAGLAHRAEARHLRAARIGTRGAVVAWVVLAMHASMLAVAGLRRPRTPRLRPPFGATECLLAGLAVIVPSWIVRVYDQQLVSRFDPVMRAAGLALAVAWLAASVLTPTPRWRRTLAITSALSVVAAAWIACVNSGMLTELLTAAWEPRSG